MIAFKKSLDLNLKNLALAYWDRINFMIYWIWTQKILELPYWTRIDFMNMMELDLKSTSSTLLDLDYFMIYWT